jgi:hypothetical protein
MALLQDQLRSIIIECMAKDRPEDGRGPLQVTHLAAEVGEIAKARDLRYNETLPGWIEHRNGSVHLRPQLVGTAWDIIWDLIIEGVLRPGVGDDSNVSLPHLHLTPYGKNAVKGVVTPHDPDGYLRRLNELVPNADPVIIQYIEESAHTLRVNCLLSSTVSLGCASEKAFLVLADAYAAALNSADSSQFQKEIEKDWKVSKQHEVFMKWYDNKLKARLKAEKVDWKDELESALNSIFDYFRGVRNEAGHPSGVQFKRDLVNHHLMVFPSYLRAIYNLIEWMNAKKPL